jgi:hypothetical protein
MESLKDLGPDTPYGNNFTQVLPSVEDGQSPQTNCSPLPNWSFAFGTGIGNNAAGTNLSYVTGTASSGLNNRVVTTQASVPLLDSTGQPTGRQIQGATTFTLTPAEVSLASHGSSWWAMGGTPSAPLNGLGSDYGFAALRCATDNLNGDNVEWVGFPQNTTHVFCYAFYVQPPPDAGTITIVKQLAQSQSASQTFDFSGSLSYNPGGAFSLTVPGSSTTSSIKFVRGHTQPSDAPWTATEDVPAGYSLTSQICTSSGGSTFTYPTNGVSITLASGDNVTCTFTNALVPAAGEITTDVITADGRPLATGVLPETFNYGIVPPSGPPTSVSTVVDPTSQSGGTGVLTLSPGIWQITPQTPAPQPGWSFELVSVACEINGTQFVPVSVGGVYTVTVPPSGTGACHFTYQVVATGGLIVRFTTIGGTGAFSAVIASPAGERLLQSATTTTPGTAVTAAGDSTNPILGTWTIIPTTPPDSAAGRWVLNATPSCSESSVTTNIGEEQLQVEVGTAAAPTVTCDYVYRLVPPSTLSVVKVATGDQSFRTHPVLISLSCADGASATLEMDPSQTGSVSLPTPLSFPLPTTCSVSETASGVSATGGVLTSSVVSVGGAATNRSPQSFAVGTASTNENVVVTVTNHYAAGLAATGISPVLQGLVIFGIFSIGAGTLLLGVRRRQRSTQG